MLAQTLGKSKLSSENHNATDSAQESKPLKFWHCYKFTMSDIPSVDQNFISFQLLPLAPNFSSPYVHPLFSCFPSASTFPPPGVFRKARSLPAFWTGFRLFPFPAFFPSFLFCSLVFLYRCSVSFSNGFRKVCTALQRRLSQKRLTLPSTEEDLFNTKLPEVAGKKERRKIPHGVKKRQFRFDRKSALNPFGHPHGVDSEQKVELKELKWKSIFSRRKSRINKVIFFAILAPNVRVSCIFVTFAF